MASQGLAVYAFSGDPITFGHVDIIERALSLFPKILVAIGTNPEKTYMFSAVERERLAREALVHLPQVTVKRFEGLVVDFAYEQGASVIIKGVRNTEDFSYEQTLNNVGLTQNQGIETIMLFAKPELAHVSSSAVKALQKSQGLVHNSVPLNVKVALEKKMSGQTLIGITGEPASGKTHVAEQIVVWGKAQGAEIHNIELDHIAHQIQEHLSEPRYKTIRETIIKQFGKKVQNKDGSINRKTLGEIVFADYRQLDLLNQIMWKPVLVRLRRELAQKKGLILINSALLAEADLARVCNNRVILVRADRSEQKKRLQQRGFSEAQIQRRLRSQYSTEKKTEFLRNSIQAHHFGTIWKVSDRTDLAQFTKKLLKDLAQ